MASAQVLPNSAAAMSRKEEHLKAGKRRLEEFRKKKAADRAKQATSQASDVSVHEKQPLDIVQERLAVSNGAVTSDGPSSSGVEPAGRELEETKSIVVGQQSEQASLNGTHSNAPFSADDKNASLAGKVQPHANDREHNIYDASRSFKGVDVNYGQGDKERNNDSDLYAGDQGRFPYEITSKQSTARLPQANKEIGNSSTRSTVDVIEEFQHKENFSKDFTSLHPNYSNVFAANITSQNSYNELLQNEPSSATTPASGRTFSFYEDLVQPTANTGESSLGVVQDMHGSVEYSDPVAFNFGGRKPSSFVSGLSSVHSESTSFNSDSRSSSNQGQHSNSTNSEASSRRSRPSFLDSLSMHKPSSGTISQVTQPEKESYMHKSLKSNNTDDPESSDFMDSSMRPFSKITNDAFSSMTSNSVDLVMPFVNENSIKGEHEYYSLKQHEDFSALEQHIADLTQEKFSFQRALDASQSLAESLAAENSSLTDSYNQQRSVVNQLKSELENLQEEIKTHLAELESIQFEYANAQLECNAADERAKLLASEVIDLEEKVLRLRSSELKLERQLENSQSEMSSYKKRISTLEKDRRDLQLSIDAFQEEKKLLQSELWKACTSGEAVEANKSHTDKKDMSTSTKDLANADTAVETSKEMHDTASLLQSDTSSFPLLPENGQLNLDISAVNIPPDQMRVIQNISQLISELTLEKEELMQALASKSYESSKLKNSNEELSRKLEVQTQRLELLTAQSMVNDHIPARRDAQSVPDSIAYADEGDEVVDRVLGWIMHLFPGGPSKRRTSKLV